MKIARKCQWSTCLGISPHLKSHMFLNKYYYHRLIDFILVKKIVSPKTKVNLFVEPSRLMVRLPVKIFKCDLRIHCIDAVGNLYFVYELLTKFCSQKRVSKTSSFKRTLSYQLTAGVKPGRSQANTVITISYNKRIICMTLETNANDNFLFLYFAFCFISLLFLICCFYFIVFAFFFFFFCSYCVQMRNKNRKAIRNNLKESTRTMFLSVDRTLLS